MNHLKTLFLMLVLVMTAGNVKASTSAQRNPTLVEEPLIPKHERRFGRARALIVVLGDNEATETTDYVVPYGILAESGVAEVLALSTGPGPIQMRPALRFQVHATIAEFDERYPTGADYVIVPNIYKGAEKPHVLTWVREQSRLGATIVGICDGVPVLANAGLLAGRRATGHWRSIDALERRHRTTRWMRNRRYVADGNVITTSGVSASIPISIALIEAIGGRTRAREVANVMGVRDWSSLHDSSEFRLGSKSLTALANKALWWRHERLGVATQPGVDEIALALTADLYSRTRRSWAFSVAATDAPLPTRRGLTLLPDKTLGSDERFEMLPLLDGPPAEALTEALEGIEQRYGRRSAALVAVQIEYPFEKQGASRPVISPGSIIDNYSGDAIFVRGVAQTSE